MLIVHVLAARETPSELHQEAAPVVVPPKELRPSVSEDEELAELGCLLEIDVGEALEMALVEVRRRWFSTSGNMATALELREVIERGGEESHQPVVQPVVGYWGNIIDPLDTT
jgi:hypothetical protein